MQRSKLLCSTRQIVLSQENVPLVKIVHPTSHKISYLEQAVRKGINYVDKPLHRRYTTALLNGHALTGVWQQSAYWPLTNYKDIDHRLLRNLVNVTVFIYITGFVYIKTDPKPQLMRRLSLSSGETEDLAKTSSIIHAITMQFSMVNWTITCLICEELWVSEAYTCKYILF